MRTDFFKSLTKKGRVIGLFVLLAISFQTTARPKVSSRVDKYKMPLNSSLIFTIQVEFQTERPKNLIFPDLSGLQDFNVLEKWSATQESISFINGQMTRKRALKRNYRLQPKTQGRLRLDSFNVQVDRAIFKTKEVFITVIPPVKSSPSQPLFLSPVSPGFNSLFPPPFFQQKREGKTRLKFKLFLDKPNAYVGEMVLADWVTFSSSGGVKYQVEKMPTLKGFWKEELVEPSGNLVFLGTEVIDNVLYRKELLHSIALFPVEAGDLEIDPYTIRVMDLLRFAGRRGTIKSTTSHRFPVKPLPSEGRGNFSGAVGDFTVQASLSETETQTGKPLSYKLRFEGEGQVRDIQSPEIPFPSSLKTYPPAEKSEFTVKKSWKEFEFLIIPKSTGVIAIPSFSLTTFYPKSGRYRTHQIPTLSFNVTKGDGKGLTENMSFFNKGDKEPEKPQWIPLRKNSPFFLNQKILLKFWIIFYSLLILAFVFLYSIRRSGWTKISVEANLEIQLKKIQELANKKQPEKAAVALINLIYQTVSHMTQDREPSQEWRKMLQVLPPSLHRQFANPLTMLIQDLEDFSFAPKKDSPVRNQIQPLFKRTRNLLKKLVSSISHTTEDSSE